MQENIIIMMLLYHYAFLLLVNKYLGTMKRIPKHNYQPSPLSQFCQALNEYMHPSANYYLLKLLDMRLVVLKTAKINVNLLKSP